MTIDFILQSAHQRGNDLLKCFPHEPNFIPHVSLDVRTHKAMLIVDTLNKKTERGFPVNVLTTIPKTQAVDVLSMLYRDCVRELCGR
jgi:hypothetical protein